MRICYVPSDMDAPGCYRCLFPGRQLAKAGVEVVMPPRNIIDVDGKRRFNFNVSFSPPEPAANIWVIQSRFERTWAEDGIQLLRMSGVATVADVDDNYEELPAWNPAFAGTHPYRRDDGVIVNRAERRKLAKKLGCKVEPNKQNRLYLHEMFEKVDAMTVSTPYLKELYSQYNANIHVVRNYVDWDMWEEVTPQYDVRRWKDRIRVGYPGVYRYRQGDLAVIRDIIRPILNRYPHVDFVANSADVHDYLNVPHRQRVLVKEYDFLNIDTGEYAMPRKTATMDIGLIPLCAGGLNEGKSHLKGMEMNAAGIPYIASNTESYRYFTHEGLNGYIVNNKQEWTDRLETLINHVDHRRSMGRYGRQYVEQNHTIQNNYDQWLDVYESVSGNLFTKLSRGAIARGAVQKVSELSAMLELVADIKPEVVVEVGSARGGTFWALAAISDPEALLVSIDIPAGSPIDVRDGKDVYTGRNRSIFRKLIQAGQRCVLIDADSQQLSTVNRLHDTLDTQPIDVLFIDADHRYEGVKRDWELYMPLVRDGGLIFFHDMTPQNDPRSGVHKLWAEIKKENKTVEFVGGDNWGWGKWGGIGVVKKHVAVRA